MKFKKGDRVVVRNYQIGLESRDCYGTVDHLEGENVYCYDWSVGVKTGFFNSSRCELVGDDTVLGGWPTSYYELPSFYYAFNLGITSSIVNVCGSDNSISIKPELRGRTTLQEDLARIN